MTTEKGFKYVGDLVEKCRRSTTMLMAAIPCTGGSMWTHFNVKRLGREARLRRHLTVFRKIWRCFELCACKLIARGGVVINEWPRGCSYWKLKHVKELFNELKCDFVDFGCKLGLVGKRTGNPIMKPWRFGAHCPEILKLFSGYRCARDHAHEHCAGSNIKATEGYTFPIVSLIHKKHLRIM